MMGPLTKSDSSNYDMMNRVQNIFMYKEVVFL